MKTDTYTYIDDKVMNIDENLETSECNKCQYMFPICMIENNNLCCKRINEVMERVFRD